MAQVTVQVGGRSYDLACRDGEEPHLQSLAALVDDKAIQAGRAVGTTNEARQLLLAALLLADEMADLRAGAAPVAAPVDPAIARAIEALADRMESLAERLEKSDDAP